MDYPNRKSLRLKGYDYTSYGYYFLTICAYENKCIFSHIHVDKAAYAGKNDLTEIGQICAQELLALPNRFPNTEIVKYVIMPNHLHLILADYNQNDSVSATKMMQAYKSLAARKCRQIHNIDKVFQKSYYDLRPCHPWTAGF